MSVRPEPEYVTYIWEVFQGEDYEGGEVKIRSLSLRTAGEYLIWRLGQPHRSKFDTEYLKTIEKIKAMIERDEKEGRTEDDGEPEKEGHDREDEYDETYRVDEDGGVTYGWHFGSTYYELRRVGVAK